MFGFITSAVENALDIVTAPFNGEDVTKRQIAKLVSDGFSIAIIATMFGVAEDVITDLIAD